MSIIETYKMPAHSDEATATKRVADRLVAMVSEEKNMDAILELYADDVMHVEPVEMNGSPRVTRGKTNVIAKQEHFDRVNTIHASTCGTPIINGDQFVCPMSLDCTCSEGPMAGKRMLMSETALYTVRNGKILEGKFFYNVDK